MRPLRALPNKTVTFLIRPLRGLSNKPFLSRNKRAADQSPHDPLMAQLASEESRLCPGIWPLPHDAAGRAYTRPIVHGNMAAIALRVRIESRRSG